MKHFISVLVFAFVGFAHAQEIAILDQGFNTTKTNNGQFYNPLCVAGLENWVGTSNSFYQEPYNALVPIPERVSLDVAKYITMYNVNLCNTGHGILSSSSTRANVPRTRSISANNTSGSPYLKIGMWDVNAPVYDFSLPFGTQYFGSNLRHGTDVANAAYEFDSAVRRKMVQLAYIRSVPTDTQNCSTNASVINRNTSSFGGTTGVTQALNKIIQNPDGVDAVNMSFQFRQNYCDRIANVPFSLCTNIAANNPGQAAVDQLKDLGIAVVTGLLNEDIGNNEKTWPACLDGVIKVGAQNGNSNNGGDGIGIGANGIDFYAKNTVVANNPIPGNSFAAPRIATAYALLKNAVPNATVDQITFAMEGIIDTSRTHDGYIRTYVRKTDIPDVIPFLEDIVRGNIDVIGYEDENEYGPLYDEGSTDYTFEFDFDDLIGTAAANASSGFALGASQVTVPNNRDVVLSFDGLSPDSGALPNGFKIYINNTLRETTQTFNNSQSFEITFEREFFSANNNTIRIEPRYARPWGLTNIKADFTPVIELTIGVTDANEYGSTAQEERPTGLRASFEVENTDNDVKFGVVGWDINNATEMAVYLNGVEQDHLTPSNFSQYNIGDVFVFDKAGLVEGGNVIELVQKVGAYAGWAVKDMLVVQEDPSSSALILGNTDTTQYGRNYGTNLNTFELDASFTPLSQHDHKISWNVYDVEQAGDVDIYLNDTLIKSAETTANNSLGGTETITLASRLFQTGVNTLTFKTKVGGTDDTWGVTNIQVRTSDVIDLDDPTNLGLDYGYFAKYTGDIPIGWTRTYSLQDYQSRLYAQFDHIGSVDKIISIAGWDIDSPAEVSVYLNDIFLQYVTSAGASSIYSPTDRITIPSGNLLQGVNTISFRTDDILTGFQSEKWGIRFNSIGEVKVNIAPIIMLLMED